GITNPVEEVNAVWGDIEAGEIMFCPVPRDPNGDGNYYIGTRIHGFLIVNGAANPEAVALFAACERFKIMDPTVISIDKKQLIEKYKWNDEMLDMYDHCMELSEGPYTVLTFSHGLGNKLYDSAIEHTMNLGRHADASTWAQVTEKYSEQIEYYIAELNNDVAEYVATLG
ncbi:MAG: hypothetical protein IJX54_01770, partial [Oscillospiraceae bacterium]|nr:hypothetical protein [Oscillospiraceae bacterium]